MSVLLKILFIFLPAVLHTAKGDYLAMTYGCFWSRDDLSDMELIETQIMNEINYIKYNSILGKIEGYTESGIRNAEKWNKDTELLNRRKADVEAYCKYNARNYYSKVLSKTERILVPS